MARAADGEAGDGSAASISSSGRASTRSRSSPDTSSRRRSWRNWRPGCGSSNAGASSDTTEGRIGDRFPSCATLEVVTAYRVRFEGPAARGLAWPPRSPTADGRRADLVGATDRTAARALSGSTSPWRERKRLSRQQSPASVMACRKARRSRSSTTEATPPLHRPRSTGGRSGENRRMSKGDATRQRLLDAAAAEAAEHGARSCQHQSHRAECRSPAGQRLLPFRLEGRAHGRDAPGRTRGDPATPAS